MKRQLSVDEVHTVLLDRISGGMLSPGAKLPSCRALADELGSNPNTVNRAVHRLSEEGLVRTVPRKGSFVARSRRRMENLLPSVQDDIERLITRARAAGVSPEAMMRMFEAALDSTQMARRFAFVECNPDDLASMSSMIERATGVAVKPLLIQELAPDGPEPAWDLLVTPLFHLAEVLALAPDPGRVVELNFIPSAEALRQLATVPQGSDVLVVARTDRGLARLSSLVRQYHGGPHREILLTPSDDRSVLDGAELLVYNNASQLDPSDIERATRALKIEWVLDGASAEQFRARVVAAAAAAV